MKKQLKSLKVDEQGKAYAIELAQRIRDEHGIEVTVAPVCDIAVYVMIKGRSIHAACSWRGAADFLAGFGVALSYKAV